MTLLQSIESAITLYGKSESEAKKSTLDKLKSYRKKAWLLACFKDKESLEPKHLKKELKTLETAISHLRYYPSEHSEDYYQILYFRYLYQAPLTKDALMARLHIEERTYYRRKKEALSLLALVLTLDED